LAIKNVGENVIDAIVEEIKNNGPFKSIENFVQRISSKNLNKKSMESLIKTGAFDEFAERQQLLHNLERLLEWSRENQKNKINGQKGLFEKTNFNEQIKLVSTKPATNFEKLGWEKELLGLYVSSHPLEDFRDILSKKTTALSKIKSAFSDQKVLVGGIISSVKKIITKTGKPMLFLKLEDLTDRAEVIVFPTIISKNPTVFQENKIVFIAGRVNHRDDTPKVIAENIEEIIAIHEN